MSQMFILVKDKETMHTYSDNVMVKNVKKGWRLIAIVRGWNMSISIDNEV